MHITCHIYKSIYLQHKTTLLVDFLFTIMAMELKNQYDVYIKRFFTAQKKICTKFRPEMCKIRAGVHQ